MNFIVADNYESMSRLAAERIAERIRSNPSSVIGFATGSTPIATYQELIRLHKETELDFSGVTTFNLDEYIGLAPDNPNSYHAFMGEQLFDHINVSRDRVNIPKGNAANLADECDRFERLIVAAGGIDLQILGIGTNGHIGFNEPGEDPDSRTHIVALAESTIQANARFFESMDEVPKQAVTMGIRSILDSREILLLASGDSKAETMRQFVEGDVTSDFPASYLKRHANVTIMLDRASAKHIVTASSIQDRIRFV